MLTFSEPYFFVASIFANTEATALVVHAFFVTCTWLGWMGAPLQLVVAADTFQDFPPIQ